MSLRERLSPSQTDTRHTEYSPSSETRAPDFIFYAGTSHRREHFLKYCFPFSNVISIPAGPEEKTHYVDRIMQAKIETVSQRARAILSEFPEKSGIIVAADVEAFPLTLERGITANQGRGKPQSLEEVRENFARMYEASKEMSEKWGKDFNPYYLVNASSGVRNLKTGDFYTKHHNCVIELNPQAVRDFSTPQGFIRYVSEFKDFFSSPGYLYNGAHPAICPTDVAGGFDTSVLSRMGAIKAIDAVDATDPRFRESLSYLISHSNIGIHSTVLRPFNPNVDQTIKQWPWLQKVTDYAMGLD